MKVLGYIITPKKLQGINGFVEQVDDISKADSTKPILIIGYQNAKQYDNYNILNRKLGDNLYWTFSRTENRSEYENDLNKFYDTIKKNAMDSVEYKYINIFTLSYSKLKKILNILSSMEEKTIYISDNMLYLLYKDIVYGISLTIIEYCKIGRDKVMKKLMSNKFIKVINDDDWKVSKLNKFLENKKYAIPYFMQS